ncbi:MULTISPECIES: LCP family protein [unclassified Nocardioides]|uniref:LCP family protein n=1 Tax=unclassified Nocardioides TaxID=2615069 RepID=UPI003619C07D
MRRAWRHLARVAVVLAAVGLVVPASGVHPVTISLSKVDSVKEVDFDGGTVWLLLLGSDARPGEELATERTDAIQLVGIDLTRGRAAGIGIPRDAWVDVPGEGPGRINTVLAEAGADGVADVVETVVGIRADYVLLTGFEGFRAMVDAVGGVDVRVAQGFFDPELGLRVHEGVNSFDGEEALSFARSRKTFGGGDFTRSANQQALMLGILRDLVAHEDEPGFLEGGALAALTGFETALSPVEIYRLAQAVTKVRPDRVTSCVLPGSPRTTSAGAAVIDLDAGAAQAVGADAADDVRLERCPG